MIDIRKSGTYVLLTNNGKKPAAHNNGRVTIDADRLAVEAETICNMLCGKGFNYYHIALILGVAKDAFRETALTRAF